MTMVSKCSTFKDMKTLPQYISQSKVKRTHAEWAEIFGMSRAHFTEVLNGTARPSAKAIMRINDATRGKVPPQVWFRAEAAE